MANIFLCIMFACMFAQYFYINLNVQVLNNTVENMPLEVVSTCVDLRNETPFIDPEILEEQVNEYYDYYLPNLDHHASFSYYNIGGEILIENLIEPTRVDITLTSNFSMFYSYSKTMYYEITEGI